MLVQLQRLLRAHDASLSLDHSWMVVSVSIGREDRLAVPVLLIVLIAAVFRLRGVALLVLFLDHCVDMQRLFDKLLPLEF